MKIYFERKKGHIIFYEAQSKYNPPLKFMAVIKDSERPKEVYLKWVDGTKREQVSSGVERNKVYRFPYFEISRVEWEIEGREIQYRTGYREYSSFKYRGNKRSICPKRMFQYRRPGLGRVIEKADHRGYFWI